MTQHNKDGSAITQHAPKPAKWLIAACVALIVSLALVLTTSIHPSAYAESTKNVQHASSATVLVYMNGSDLESEGGEASSDITEMLKSNIGANANVLIETLGTKEWQNHGIASDHTQRYIVNKGSLELVDDSLGQLDTTDPKTLSDFISWGVSKYPADRYILVLWDHGAGPVYGFGYDEFQSEESALTLDEMQQAFDANPGVHFDIIGMDCCIMGSIETCVALQPYCNYIVASEDFEPGIGWSYANWMSILEKDPSTDTVELGKTIINDMITDVAADRENGEATLALIDESKVSELFNAWTSFAYASEGTLLESNYSQETEWRDRPSTGQPGNARADGPGDWGRDWEDWDYDGSYVTMTDYFVTDIKEVASAIDNEKSNTLKTALENALVHYGSTSGEQGMSGLGVTLPYGDAEFYDQLTKVFIASGIDENYVKWLETFVNAEGADSYYYDYYDYHSYHDYDDSYGYSNGYGHSHGFGEFDYGPASGYGMSGRLGI